MTRHFKGLISSCRGSLMRNIRVTNTFDTDKMNICYPLTKSLLSFPVSSVFTLGWDNQLLV